jgi:NACHT domain
MPYFKNNERPVVGYSVLNDIARDLNVYNLLNSQDEENQILAALNPAVVKRGGYEVLGCMEGTRKGMFKEIDGWLDDFSAPNILWISGSPGSGKSAVASSLVSELNQRERLASYFFCKRDHARLGDPAVLWRTVAFDLARFHPGVKSILLEILKKANFMNTDILLHFRCLIVEPLLKNPDHSSAPSPVIVLNALDECGSDESQSPQRCILLKTIALWSSRLPLTCKLIVTSRDEPIQAPIHDDPLYHHHIILETGDSISHSTADDIRVFLEKSFADIRPKLGLSNIWPGKPKEMQLTKRAAGLFIWAKSTIAFIAENQGNPNTKLQLILKGELGKGKEKIDSLYRQILHFAFKSATEPQLELFRAVIGAIAIAKVPLHRSNLKHYLSREDDEDDRQISVILHNLSSVISKEDNGLLHLRHLSFVEFLTDAKRCHQFFIDEVKHRRNLMLACLRLMNRDLKFNICGLETSHC